jgi:hypothetical protein
MDAEAMDGRRWKLWKMPDAGDGDGDGEGEKDGEEREGRRKMEDGEMARFFFFVSFLASPSFFFFVFFLPSFLPSFVFLFFSFFFFLDSFPFCF